MKLKKHIELFVRVFLNVVSREENKRFARDELIVLINNNINDKRITINTQHLNKIVKKQTEYDCETTRKHYEFKEKTSK